LTFLKFFVIIIVEKVKDERGEYILNIFIIIIIVFWVATTVTVMAEMAPQVREDLSFWQEAILLITLTLGAPFMLIT
jgi:hypothetical protein